MVAKKTETPQWGNAPDSSWAGTPDPSADAGDIPDFLKRDKNEAAQTDLEDFTGESPSPAQAGEEEAPQQSPSPAAEPPHDPETGELEEPQQHVPAPEPGSPEETEEVPDYQPPQGGDGRELSPDDNGKPRNVFDEMAGGNVAGDQLRAFVERIERLNEDKQAIADDIKEVYAEMKATGFDTGTVRKIVQLRKMDQAQRQEAEAMLDLYKTAIGMA